MVFLHPRWCRISSINSINAYHLFGYLNPSWRKHDIFCRWNCLVGVQLLFKPCDVSKPSSDFMLRHSRKQFFGHEIGCKHVLKCVNVDEICGKSLSKIHGNTWKYHMTQVSFCEWSFFLGQAAYPRMTSSVKNFEVGQKNGRHGVVSDR